MWPPVEGWQLCTCGMSLGHLTRSCSCSCEQAQHSSVVDMLQAHGNIYVSCEWAEMGAPCTTHHAILHNKI